MLNSYRDIRDRIADPPKWWDEAGVPRYDEFTPHETADIYAREAALVLIRCQNCKREFRVAFSFSDPARIERAELRPLEDQIKAGAIHYGDPPNADCCGAGPTMNCEDLRVLEYWRRTDGMTWVRDSSLEILLPDASYFEGN